VRSRHAHKGGRRHGGRSDHGHWLLQRGDHGGHVGLRDAEPLGQGQVVALMGAAGVGKSRLVYEFVHAHHTQGWRVLESASVSYGRATPYFPVIDLLKRYGHLEDGDDPRPRRAKVTGQVLTLDETLQDTLPALLALLDALPTDSPFLTLDPPQRRQRTLEALKRVLLRESQVQPWVLVFEDLHWIDSETQALLNNLHGSQGPCRLVPQTSYDHSVDNVYIIFSGPMNTRIPPPFSTLPIERFWQWLKAKVYGVIAFNTMEDVFRQIRQRIWHYHEGWLTSTIHWAFTLYQEILEAFMMNH